MMRLILAALAATIATVSYAEDHSGQYFCVRSATGGLSMKDGKPNGFGPITFDNDRSRFFLTIEPVQRNELDVSFCKKSVDALIGMLEQGHTYEDFDKNVVGPALRRSSIGWECFTKDRLLLKAQGKRPEEFRSYELQSEFYGIVPPENFSFFAGDTFKQIEEFDSGTVAISYGQCEKIVPPK